MLRLIYFSTARLGLGPADLENILSRAVAYNLSRGVTGILLFNGLNFLQVLEGPRHAVEELYEKIGQDARHTGVALIKTEEVSALSYPEWGMKLKELDADLGEDSLLRLNQEVADALVVVSSADVKTMIKAFLSLN
jgi:hypothetical protein